MSILFLGLILVMIVIYQWSRWKPLYPNQLFANGIVRYGHRGAAKTQPENTIAAFKQAISDGCNGIELDVHLTRDGALAVIHDKSLKRTTGAEGTVADYTRETLKSLNAAANWPARFEAVPTLEEVFEAVPDDTIVNIEIKDYQFWATPRIETAVARFIRDHGLYHRVIVSSFYPFVLGRVKRLDDRIITASLWDYTDWRQILVILFLLVVRPDILHPYHQAIRPWIRWLARTKHMAIQTWVVNDAEQLVTLTHDPLIKGIMSDDSVLINQILTQKE